MIKYVFLLAIVLFVDCMIALIRVPKDTARQLPNSQDISAKVITRYHQNKQNRLTINELADLTLYKDRRRLWIRSENNIFLDVSFDNIEKVVFNLREEKYFESTTSNVLGLAGAVLVSPALLLASTAAADEKIDSVYWCCIDYKDAYGRTQSCLFSTPQLVRDNIRSALGGKVVDNKYQQKNQEIDLNTLKEQNAEFECIIDNKIYPAPEIKSEKALLVFVYSILPYRHLEIDKKIKPKRWGPFIILANNNVIAVIKSGCYSYCYLDPSDYLLVTKEKKHAYGININLEAGTDYYFFQDFYLSSKWGGYKIRLFRVPKEHAMSELSAAYYCTWKRKN